MTTGTVPRQTLTFLFADLRDYTAFVERYGDAAAAALIADYRRLVRNALAKAAGAEIKTEGDSFYVVFPSASQALRCATAILREADRTTRERPERPLRIGIGIHAGEPVPHEGQFVGSAVNLAARLAQQARAGEILVSEVVRGLLRTSGGAAMEERTGLVLKGAPEASRAFAVAWQEQSPETARAESRTVAVSIPAEPPADLRILCPELVGRERELAQLEGFLRDAVDGKGRAVLVAGDAGVGKSALLRAFAERARSSGPRFLLGECMEVEARRPFGPFVQILRAAFRELSATAVERSLRENAVELLRLLPELSRGQAGAAPIDESERYRIHESFVSLFADLARGEPLALAIEDLHWADEATLELFPYLARKLRDQPVLLVASYRSDELYRLHPLNHVLADLARARAAERVRLAPLTPEQTGAVIRAALGLKRPPTAEFREAIHARCEGNPFFVEEVLKALVERGDLVYRDGAWEREKDVADLAIPESVRDAVQQRLRLLSPEARRAVQVAAVVGQRFGFELLQRVSGLAESNLLDALRSAIEAQVLVEEADHGGQELYAFRHALTREAVLAELLQRERRLLHRAVGEAIEASVGADAAERAEELAYHFDQARDTAKAFRYHELAAREATRSFAFLRAVRHLERAIELAPDDEPSLGELQLRLGEAANLSVDLPRAARAAEEARRVFEESGDGRRLGAALRFLSSCRWSLGETRVAGEHAREALRVLEPLGESPELAETYARLAGQAAVDGRDEEAMEWAQRALAMAERTNAVRARVNALLWVGPLVTLQGRVEGLDRLREALALALEHELVHEAQRVYQHLGVATFVLGYPRAEQRALLGERRRHARRYGYRSGPYVSDEASMAFLDGDWDAALRFVAELRGETIWSAALELLEAFIVTAREGPERGLPLVDAPRRRLLSAGDAQWLAWAGGLSAAVTLIAGDPAAALRHAEEIADLVARDAGHPGVSWAAVAALFAARELGDAEALRRWIDLASTRAAASEPRHARERRAIARAERSVEEGDRSAAIALLAEHAELFDESLSFYGTLARLRRAELLLERDASGDRDAAAAELAAVVPFWRGAKATWYLERLREWAASRGLPLPEP